MEEQALRFRLVKYINFVKWDELGYGWCVEQSARMFKERDLFNRLKGLKLK